LAQIILIPQFTIRKFSPTRQIRYMEMTSYLTSSKCRLQTKTDI